jgi:hypothetical protein
VEKEEDSKEIERLYVELFKKVENYNKRYNEQPSIRDSQYKGYPNTIDKLVRHTW